MKLESLVEVDGAIDALLPQIKNNARLAFRLGRIKDLIAPDVKKFKEARIELFKQHGTQLARVTSPSIMIEDYRPVAQEGGKLTFDIPVDTWESIKDKYPKATEMGRDFYQVTDPKAQELVNKEIEGLLAMDLEVAFQPLDIAMFDGVEASNLGAIIQAMRSIITDTD